MAELEGTFARVGTSIEPEAEPTPHGQSAAEPSESSALSAASTACDAVSAPTAAATPGTALAPAAPGTSARRTLRDRLNDEAARKLIVGSAITLLGGTFWGLSGTCTNYLLAHYHVDVVWLLSVRQILGGLLFMVTALATDRQRLRALWTTPRDLALMLAFAVFGLLFSQFSYMVTVGLTNAGTATVLQCLQLLFILAYACATSRRRPHRREVAGIALALAGTFLISTGGNPANFSIPPMGLVMGLCTALAAALMAIIPVRILPRYGSTVVTGSAMFTLGVGTNLAVQPWRSIPTWGPDGWVALAVLVVVGTFLAFLLYLQGLRDVGSMRAGLLGTSEPIAATLASAVVLGIVFTPTDLVGFALIILMVFLTV